LSVMDTPFSVRSYLGSTLKNRQAIGTPEG